MTTIFEDGFSNEGTTDVNLASHAPDTTGDGWTEFINTASLTPIVDASQQSARPNGNSGNNTLAFAIDPAPSGADGTLTVVASNVLSGTNKWRGGFLRAVDTSNWISFGMDRASVNPDLNVSENVAGTITALATYDQDADDGTLTMEISGTSLVVGLDGSPVGTVTVTGTLTGAAGMYFGAMMSDSGADVRDNELSYFRYDDDGGGGGGSAAVPVHHLAGMAM